MDMFPDVNPKFLDFVENIEYRLSKNFAQIALKSFVCTGLT